MERRLLSPKRWLIQGIAITLPLVVTLLILIVVLDFILGVISPVIGGVAYLWPDEPSTVVIQVTTILSLVGFFLLVGILADITPGEHIYPWVDRVMSTIPGISTVYTTVQRVSDIVVEDDQDQLKDVKLIEFPHENAYMLSFLIGDAPDTIEDCVGEGEMQTIMLPLGPNPTTNGFIMHMPTDHVHDVDMTVEEAVQSIATLGVAEVKMEDEELGHQETAAPS
ncbi:hypothetical protein BRC65_09545 [Halobacteriales archaeon QH_2_65_14]|nr:MAG: hypothetical protein BRC65_09545 [Halobacteriales archaeon QH_2_65_14]